MTEQINLEHCCKIMDYYADKNYKHEHEVIRYDSEVREYYLSLHGKNYATYQTLHYCPWCGEKLPKILGEEWCKIIEEKFGYDLVGSEEFAKLPEEFRTDEWWKKRGL